MYKRENFLSDFVSLKHSFSIKSSQGEGMPSFSKDLLLVLLYFLNFH